MSTRLGVDWSSSLLVRSKEEAEMLKDLDNTDGKWYMGDLYYIKDMKPFKYSIKVDSKIR
jgi:hypothetical protein